MIEGGLIPSGNLRPGWRYAALGIVIAEFVALGWIAANAYSIKPPVPEKVVGPAGTVVFTGADIVAGQQIFLRYDLMDNGTLWGHGAYLGPDFTASYLHQLAMDAKAWLSQRRPADSPAARNGELTAEVGALLAENRYNPASGVLAFTQPEADSYIRQLEQWRAYFTNAAQNRGLPRAMISDPEELRQLTAFFAWSAWATVARVPGRSYSYTNNFPYEPAIGNGPSSAAILWSGLSLITLLAGTAAVLLAFGKFDYLGWRAKDRQAHIHPSLLPGVASPSQRATLKFFLAVALMFLGQVLVGGGVAHFRAQPEGFYGLDLAAIFPSNILRSLHLQLAIFWIATAFVAGGAFLASALGGTEPRGQVKTLNVLFILLLVIVTGTLVGDVLGVRQVVGKWWYWFGNQGWEYLQLGRFWQWALVAALLIWAMFLVRALQPSWRRKEHRELSALFLLTAFTIPIFYLPALFFTGKTNFTVVDTWRFWIIHLWVEGFFELFATVMVAVLFYKMDMVSRRTATRVIYLDAILFLGSGILGTGHHWYWTGQSTVSMALSATFSAMEVVPLILLTLDASAFVRLTRSRCDECGQPVNMPHKWTFYFLIAVGVWNFIGAGIFGFLINLPVISYYQAGTNLTANHAHGAMMGVFGMLGIAFLVFALRQMSAEADWVRTQKYVKVSFWGLNIGLGLMIVLSLFPTGVLQLYDVILNGYWHGRSAAFLNSPLMSRLEWARLPADIIFIVLGVVPLVIAAVRTWLMSQRHRSESTTGRI
ncbi:MAG: cbb3-type cytochrome c oxidase subunit I [Planctomycetaceae bacterium]|nr:cbb3-type cytochrome c oxidase subunit I [Planctomycetaceae bacterium]